MINKIEYMFWSRGCRYDGKSNTNKTVFASLRHRFSFLMNYASILRSESLHLAELSDLRVFAINRPGDIDKMPIVLMECQTGKTIKAGAPSQFARATRHRNVMACPIGAMAMYLFFRFHMTEEFSGTFNQPDLRNNSSWFDFKILTSADGSPTESVKVSNFRTEIENIFNQLGIVSDYTTHWCRHIAPTHCEFKEISPELIKQLGKCSLVPLCSYDSQMYLTGLYFCTQVTGIEIPKRHVILLKYLLLRSVVWLASNSLTDTGYPETD